MKSIQWVIVQEWLGGLDLFVAMYPLSRWHFSYEVDIYPDKNLSLHFFYLGSFQFVWWTHEEQGVMS